MKRVYEYMMMEPSEPTDLPTGIVDYTVYKDEHGTLRHWGYVLYDRVLTDEEVERHGLDGPLPCWI